jgi:DNA polymerase I-like protein with 3'-5' exonuclease and polymerase domains
MIGLFSEEFNVEFSSKSKSVNVSDLVKKSDPTSAAAKLSAVDTAKVLKSRKITLLERLDVIKAKVIKTLGKQRDNVAVIRTLDDFNIYIDKIIARGAVAIDTETNNSLDPVTCKLMGLCLYTADEKQAYVPVNHVDPETGIRLENQLTEKDCRAGLQRILDANTFIIMHNGKFDYEVLKTTCGIDVPPNWDTMVAARLLNENELANLKYQYTSRIDPSQDRYDIESLFENIQYAYVEPEIFALYAATDSMMTYKLYLHQLPLMTAPEMVGVYQVFSGIEMPIVTVTAEMELRGVSVDTQFGSCLKVKYKKQLDEIDEEIQVELNELEKTVIGKWRVDPNGGLVTPRVYEPKNTVKTAAQIAAAYPNIDTDAKLPDGTKNPNYNRRYKNGKKKAADLLGKPINLASPVQLAILFYDILKCPIVDSKSPRGTGEDELKSIAEIRPDLTICNLILKRRGLTKLVTTYINVIPDLVKHWPDGRIRFHLNSVGTDTGRYSSGGKLKFFENDEAVEVSGINIQNIPSKNKEIRMLFRGDTKYRDSVSDNNCFTVQEFEEVETVDGWKVAAELEPLVDQLIIDDTACLLMRKIQYNNKQVELFIEEISA